LTNIPMYNIKPEQVLYMETISRITMWWN
jgi:hypothetical protein